MKIFCSGIGGIGLSAYAAYQRASGHFVTGSERVESAILADLRCQGIAVSLGQDGDAVPADADLFVYTLALPDDHPERLRARALGIPEQTYFRALGDLTRGSELIAVCGTHGKSSTTAMAARVLIEAGRDPSVILGTKTQDLGGRNWRKGSSKIFLVEACEYRRSFLHLSPKIILLTNADGDHFDAFRDREDYVQAFTELMETLPSDGVLITHLRDRDLPPIVEAARKHGARVIDADAFLLPTLRVPGRHMQENAQLVFALAQELGIPQKQASAALANYAGSWRRSDIRGETPQGALVIDDYGHHPVEIAATLRGLREAYPGRRIVCVFQPHTHDRTLKLYDAFLHAFIDADVVLVPEVYDARPKEGERRADPLMLARDIARVSGKEVRHSGSLEATVALLQRTFLRNGDVLVTMGAGDVWRVAEALLAQTQTLRA